MFIEVLIIAIIAGYILKGTVMNFKNVNLYHSELAFLGFIVQVCLVVLIRMGVHIDNIVIYSIHLLMYILILSFVFLNRNSYNILILGAGFLLNAIAIFTNGGVMPVSSSAAVMARIEYIVHDISSQGMYKLLDNKTRLPLFCDIIPLPYPRPFVISIGDIVIAIGLFITILNFMGVKFSKSKTNLSNIKS